MNPPHAPLSPGTPQNPSADSSLPPLGGDPAEREPIANLVAAVEAILRQPRRVLWQLSEAGARRPISLLLLSSIGCSLVYGLVVGSFSGGVQFWAAPVKVAGGLLLSALICLPSLYLLVCLSGAQARLVHVCGLVAGLLALMNLLLVGFAPVAWVFSQSTESIVVMGAIHLAFWFIATGFGLRFLFAGFSQLRMKTEGGLRVWVVIFLLVMLQMMTALRPIVGTAAAFLPVEKKFFLAHWSDCVGK
jgi:hypothetical protein